MFSGLTEEARSKAHRQVQTHLEACGQSLHWNPLYPPSCSEPRSGGAGVLGGHPCSPHWLSRVQAGCTGLSWEAPGRPGGQGAPPPHRQGWGVGSISPLLHVPDPHQVAGLVLRQPRRAQRHHSPELALALAPAQAPDGEAWHISLGHLWAWRGKGRGDQAERNRPQPPPLHPQERVGVCMCVCVSWGCW